MTRLGNYLVSLVAVIGMTQSARRDDVAWVLAWGFLLLVLWPRGDEA